MKEVAFRVENLTKKYKDVVAVDNVTLDVFDKELFCLLGLNGAGKTTFVKMMTSVADCTSGEIYVLGEKWSKNDYTKKGVVASSPQETAIAPNLTAKENLSLMAALHGKTKKQAQEKVQEIVSRFGLDEILNKKAGTLSGGWQRRLSIAMALVCEPKILFLDEPTLGLDVVARRELWSIVRSLKGKICVVLTTHYMEEAESLSDRIGVMKNGKILFVGTPNDLKERTNTNSVEEGFLEIVAKGDNAV